MNTSNLDSAKLSLTHELEEAPYVKEDLCGYAGSSRKIEDYIIQSILAHVDQGTCLDWIVNLLKDYHIEKQYIDKTRFHAELQYSIMDRYINQIEL